LVDASSARRIPVTEIIELSPGRPGQTIVREFMEETSDKVFSEKKDCRLARFWCLIKRLRCSPLNAKLRQDLLAGLENERNHRLI
jgi:hypothetical protein